MEIKKAGKGKYGHYLLDTDSKFHGCTEEVKNEVADLVPCKIEVLEKTEGDHPKITKIKVNSIVPNVDTAKQISVGEEMRQDAINKAIKMKTASVMISYAKDLAVAKIITTEQIAREARAFMALQEELVAGTIPVPIEEKSSDNIGLNNDGTYDS